MEHCGGIRRRWETMSPRTRHGIHIALISLVVACSYANSLEVQLIMDDVAIPTIGSRSLGDILFHGGPRKIADFTFALNYLLHGAEVFGYHLINLAVHLTSSVILYFFIASAISALRFSPPSNTGDRAAAPFSDRFVPLAAALLFAAHPIQTQAVTYIIQRYTSMATLFYLLAALLYTRARIAFEGSRPRSRILLLVLAAAVSGIMAAGSKQIAYTLPIMLLILEIFIFRGRLINRNFFIACGVLAVAATGFILLHRHGSSLKDFFFDLHYATSEDSHTSRTAYLLTQFRVVATYLRLLCLPIDQSILYDRPLYTSLFSVPVAASLSVHGLILSTMVFLFRKSGHRLSAGDHEEGILPRLAALGIVWFYVTMSVESSIFPIRDIIFEHRIYLPSAGFFLTVSAGGAMVVAGKRAAATTAWGVLVVTTLILTGMTVARNRVWDDSLLLWQDTVTKAPNHHLALSNLAVEYLDRGRPDLAIPLFVRAIELQPGLVAFKIKVYLGEALKETHLIEEWRFTTGQEYLLPDGRSSNYKSTSVMFNNLGLAYEYLKSPEKAVVIIYEILAA